jgi:serine/threonine protein kinase
MIRRLGDFELLERLAVGGMSEVYRAQVAHDVERPEGEAADLPSGEVVVKLMLPQVAQDPAFVEMLADEARLAEKLAHPNLVRVIAWGEVDRERYLALEYVDGCSLATLLAHRREAELGPLEPALALALIDALLAGLRYLHALSDEQGRALEAVHRDVTPGNVLLSRDGELKLADFGIARHGLRKGRTKTGVVKGTLQYMAPEQLADDRVDRRADVYATGLILFELLTGRPYLEAEREVELLTLAAEPCWRAPSELTPSLGPELGPEIDELLRLALERFPEQRYPDASAFSRALRRLRDGHPELQLGDKDRDAAIATLVEPLAPERRALPPSPAPPTDREPTQIRPASAAGRFRIAALVAILCAGGGLALWLSRHQAASDGDAGKVSLGPSVDARAKGANSRATAVDLRAPDHDQGTPHADLERSSPARPRDLSVARRTTPRRTKPKRIRPAKGITPPKTRVPQVAPVKAPPKPDPALQRQLQAALARLRGRGILRADLAATIRSSLRQVRKQIMSADPAAAAALKSLTSTLDQRRVDGPLVKAKLARVHRKLRASKGPAPQIRKTLAARQSLALSAYMDGRHAAANRHLNAILAVLGERR